MARGTKSDFDCLLASPFSGLESPADGLRSCPSTVLDDLEEEEREGVPLLEAEGGEKSGWGGVETPSNERDLVEAP